MIWGPHNQKGFVIFRTKEVNTEVQVLNSGYVKFHKGRWGIAREQPQFKTSHSKPPML